MISECCSAPPLLNTDVHDGIAICDLCREWSGFYDEDDIKRVKEEELDEPTTADEFNRNHDDCMITYDDRRKESRKGSQDRRHRWAERKRMAKQLSDKNMITYNDPGEDNDNNKR